MIRMLGGGEKTRQDNVESRQACFKQSYLGFEKEWELRASPK